MVNSLDTLLIMDMNEALNEAVAAAEWHVHGDEIRPYYCAGPTPKTTAVVLEPWGQHLVCFLGESIALVGALFRREDLDAAKRLVDVCISTHMALAQDTSYLMLSRAAFFLSRVTGRKDFLGPAWDMVAAIDRTAAAELVNSAVHATTKQKPQATHTDGAVLMGELLKYCYLVFGDPSLVILDESLFLTWKPVLPAGWWGSDEWAARWETQSKAVSGFRLAGRILFGVSKGTELAMPAFGVVG